MQIGIQIGLKEYGLDDIGLDNIGLDSNHAVAEEYRDVLTINGHTTFENKDLNFSKGVAVESGGVLSILNCSVRVSGNLVVKQGGRLEVYNGRFFGDYTMRIYGSAYLQGSEFSGLIGKWNASGIQVYSSEVTIVDCKVFSNKETRETILSGIMCISSSPTIIRTKVENFGLGIKVISSNAKIDSCEIKRNNKGIMAIESKPEIVSCIVEYNEEVGLGLYKSEGKVENCKIIRNSIGIECVEGTNTKILSNEIIGSNIGIKMVESSPEILQNRIVECNEGINGYYSNVIIRGNSFENDTFAYHSIGNGYPLSFMSENQILNVQSVIRQSWMLTLRIEDENENPLTANIEVRDINGKKVFEGKSREDGVVSIQLCEYQVGPDENYNPYKIKVSKGTAYEKFSIIVDNNLEKRVVIVLSEESVFSDMSLVVILAIIIFSIILFVFLLFKRRSANKRKNKGKKRKKRSSRF